MPTRTRVLLVDDHPIVISGIRRLLGFAPDFEVVGQASNAHDAVESAIAAAPDLILLDLHLPDMAGDEVLERLLRDPATSDIPVVVLSADATQDHRAVLVAAGARAYLTKPIGVRQLLGVIDEHLE